MRRRDSSWMLLLLWVRACTTRTTKRNIQSKQSCLSAPHVQMVASRCSIDCIFFTSALYNSCPQRSPRGTQRSTLLTCNHASTKHYNASSWTVPPSTSAPFPWFYYAEAWKIIQAPCILFLVGSLSSLSILTSIIVVAMLVMDLHSYSLRTFLFFILNNV